MCGHVLYLLVLVCGVLVGTRTGLGQNFQQTAPPQDRSAAAERTRLHVELLAGKAGVGFQARRWQQTFAKLGVSLRIRRGRGGEKPEIRQHKRRGLRQVTVVGRLDRRGRLIFPERTFTRNQSAQLAEWLEDLKTYGKQGSPEGKPVWGMTKAQFKALFEALSQPLETKLQGRPAEKALPSVSLDKAYPLDLGRAASRRLAGQAEPVATELKGLSHGAALAVLLNQYGLGFFPRRQPDGSVKLRVAPLDEIGKAWPVGWKPEKSRRKTVPKLLQRIPVELEDVPLKDVLDAVSAQLELPIFLDKHRPPAEGIDIDGLTVSHPAEKTTWLSLLRAVTIRHRLNPLLRIDEAGRPFLWVTVLDQDELGR